MAHEASHGKTAIAVLSSLQRLLVDGVRGMTEFDASKFTVVARLPTARVDDKTRLPQLLAHCKALLPPPLRQFKFVRQLDDGCTIIILDAAKVKTEAALPFMTRLREMYGQDPLVDEDYTIEYENWQPQQALQCVLPSDAQLSSFSQIGHIVHVNLRDEHLPFADVIGRILLDKVSGCRTVVNKAQSIGESKFRNFELQLLAGEADYVATVRENNLSFELDFSKVYWNSRLQREHDRVLKRHCARGSVVYDVFAGVGPFAVLAKRTYKCHVLANDLNPASVAFLRKNCTANKAELEAITELDGGTFIDTVAANDLANRFDDPDDLTSSAHFVMNLPALAVTFLRHFVGLLRGKVHRSKRLPLPFDVFVHVYLFTKDVDDVSVEARRQVEEAFGGRAVDVVHVHDVRVVASNKHMMCVTFKLHNKLLYAEPTAATIEGEEGKEEPCAKRDRLE